jgi:DNA-binding NtrC family response regulator
MANLMDYQKRGQRNHTILLVEDDCHLLEIIHDILLDQDYRVTKATSGEEAIELLETNGFDLVITDLIMGRTNGISVLKTVKELNQETQVIIMTGTIDINFVIEALRLNASDYLLKPFDLNNLLDRIASCLEKLERTRDNRRATKRKRVFNGHSLTQNLQ